MHWRNGLSPKFIKFRFHFMKKTMLNKMFELIHSKLYPFNVLTKVIFLRVFFKFRFMKETMLDKIFGLVKIHNKLNPFDA